MDETETCPRLRYVYNIFHEELLEQAKLQASMNYTVLSLFCLNLVEFILLFRFFFHWRNLKISILIF